MSSYNEPLLTCYALRYPDLLQGYCSGVPSLCNFGALLSHWKDHGSAGTRTIVPTRAPLCSVLTRRHRARASRGRGACACLHQ